MGVLGVTCIDDDTGTIYRSKLSRQRDPLAGFIVGFAAHGCFFCFPARFPCIIPTTLTMTAYLTRYPRSQDLLVSNTRTTHPLRTPHTHTHLHPWHPPACRAKQLSCCLRLSLVRGRPHTHELSCFKLQNRCVVDACERAAPLEKINPP